LEKELKKVRTSDFKKYANEEAKVLWKLYIEGTVREFYFRKNENLAVLILEAKSKQAAEKTLMQLPFVSRKLIEFEIIPLKSYPGFARLFVHN
jgi:muconolactone delta-isomerase